MSYIACGFAAWSPCDRFVAHLRAGTSLPDSGRTSHNRQATKSLTGGADTLLWPRTGLSGALQKITGFNTVQLAACRHRAASVTRQESVETK